MNPLGHHLLGEFTGCDPARLASPEAVREAMLAAARASGATVVAELHHHFSPLGVSGVVVVSESHLAIHTWPEHGFAAADYFSCSPRVDMACAMALLAERLGARAHTTLELQRGPLQVPPRP